jgi:tripartite-type tricarboxylate transporter receptor subunit TctC
MGTPCDLGGFLRYRALSKCEGAMISKRAFLHSVACAGMALMGSELIASTHADTYPSHPVRWVVPYAAGGATDVLSRLICQRLSERLGQPFVVENKPGAGSGLPGHVRFGPR